MRRNSRISNKDCRRSRVEQHPCDLRSKDPSPSDPGCSYPNSLAVTQPFRGTLPDSPLEKYHRPSTLDADQTTRRNPPSSPSSDPFLSRKSNRRGYTALHIDDQSHRPGQSRQHYNNDPDHIGRN